MESLANELFLDLFEYLDGLDLLRAFHGLNTRLDHLLFYHFRAYRFDLRSISKDAFTAICRDYLPLLLDGVVALTLCDDNETPNLPQLFLTHHFTLDQFIRLQSLCFDSIQSDDLLGQIIVQCRTLPNLTRLKLTGDARKRHKFDATDLVNNVWSLPQLRYCSINIYSSSREWLKKISIVSRTIEWLSIKNFICKVRDLAHLLQHTPHLDHLCTTIIDNPDDGSISPISTSIRSLKLTLESSSKVVLVQMFQLMPSLVSLTLRAVGFYLSGRRWKKLLRNYLPHLKDFRLRMYFEYRHSQDIDDQLNELIKTYRTPFWIREHHWWIQCDYISFGAYHHGTLYTLPYSFDTYIDRHAAKSRSTCPNQHYAQSYDRVTHLQCLNDEPRMTHACTQSPIQFPNLRHLKITLPFDQQLVSLDRLTTLEVRLRGNEMSHQLSTLLDRCPRIHSLHVVYAHELNISFAQTTTSTIRRLTFVPTEASNVHYFDQFQCRDFANSSIGRQCEVTTIQVDHRKNVLDLLQAMSQLRTLIVHCKDDSWTDHQRSSVEDELLQWFRRCLPSTYSITRAFGKISHIRIWIGKNAEYAAERT